jgi:hypothetical protein
MAATGSGDFLSGLIIGLLLGLVLGPILRFWVAWRAWVSASRQASLTQDVLKRMDETPWERHPDQGPSSGPPGPMREETGG